MLAIRVAVGVVMDARRRVLISYRHKRQHQGERWEFPGGKAEPNETDYQALCRELKEELGIEVVAAVPLCEVLHRYPERTVQLQVWQVTQFSSPVVAQEGQDWRWVAIEELGQYQFPEANGPILEAIAKLDF